MNVRTCLGAAAIALVASEAFAISGGGFSLSIQNQDEDGRGYVRMIHATTYAICFRNNLGRAVDAEVSIDGLPMGTWRLTPRRSACVDRPVADTGQFTFYRADSSEGYAVGSGQVARSDKGRVSVRFIPEIERHYPTPTPYAPTNRYAPDQELANDAAPSAQYGARSKTTLPSQSRLGAGVTGLSGESDQRFGTTGAIKRDWANAVTLELRLVHDPKLEQPIDPRPLPGRYDRLAPPPV